MNAQPAGGRRTSDTARRWRIWAGPMAMAVLTSSALISALVSDAWGDWWSWVGLGIPTAAIAWYAWPRAARRRGGPGERAD